MFKTVLIANRGEIACRIIRTLSNLGVRSVAIYSEADRFAQHARLADEAVCVGPAPAAQSYLSIDSILEACRQTSAEAVHPGYGFLSENPEFAERLEAEGIAFIGPHPDHLRAFGLKDRARELALAAGVPLLPGTAILESLETATIEATRIGYPVMLKSVAGGGGIGLQLCQTEDELKRKYSSVTQLAQTNFGNGSVYLERFVAEARHIEVQLFGDGQGNVAVLGERDCSLQRRNQKVIEEAPAPNLPAKVRDALYDAARKLGQSINYRSAGTIEFIYEAAQEAFYFLEVNTRLQVEHPVTEAVTGLDLVEWMVRLAAGEKLPLENIPTQKGVAIEARIYAENPYKNFSPHAGKLTLVEYPADVRVDGWVETGTEVSPFYDPMLAKLVVHGATRKEAIEKLQTALEATKLYGVETNLSYLRALSHAPLFIEAQQTTRALDGFPFQPQAIEVLKPGAQTTIQDWPGRIGLWDIGVPPSGPMDSLSFRLLNRLLVNPQGAPGLEIVVEGPALQFVSDCEIAFGGAQVEATLENKSVAPWTRHSVKAGETLTLGKLSGYGQRAYLCVSGGFDVPLYLGSASTFTLGGFGGLTGRALRTGDMLGLKTSVQGKNTGFEEIPRQLQPSISSEWTLRVHSGPHGAPDFFKESDIETLFSTAYEVHFNSSRTGVRLVGPKPEWARPDGGEAGLHPSNLHDNAYAIGAIDFTGDMPILLGPDGPSLGGFVCPAVTVRADMWKIGQLKPGDKVRFMVVSRAQADEADAEQDESIRTLSIQDTPTVVAPALAPTQEPAVLHRSGEGETEVQIRRAGSENLLVEFGPPVLDLGQRFRAHLLMKALQAEAPKGIIELTPGVRSLQIHYDSLNTGESHILDFVKDISKNLQSTDEIEIESRIVRLPLAWDHEQTRLAIRRYQELVRPDAPWCPSNIEFIRRINGLETEADVQRIVYDASYMVLGLGDVYLGAPVATPIDPRHRLVTTKYNPARTWTPENAVGIGGAYMCVYGMEGPGGYQFVGRTVQVWSPWQQRGNFERGKPWLLRFFDQVQFFPVSEEELADMRAAFPHGGYEVDTTSTIFRMREYKKFLDQNATEINQFKTRQQAAFDAERTRWAEAGLLSHVEPPAAAVDADTSLPPGATAVCAHIPGVLWSMSVVEGAEVAQGDTIAIIESMKMEIEIIAPEAGTIVKLAAKPGQVIAGGDLIAALIPQSQ